MSYTLPASLLCVTSSSLLLSFFFHSSFTANTQQQQWYPRSSVAIPSLLCPVLVLLLMVMVVESDGLGEHHHGGGGGGGGGGVPSAYWSVVGHDGQHTWRTPYAMPNNMGLVSLSRSDLGHLRLESRGGLERHAHLAAAHQHPRGLRLESPNLVAVQLGATNQVSAP